MRNYVAVLVAMLALACETDGINLPERVTRAVIVGNVKTPAGVPVVGAGVEATVVMPDSAGEILGGCRGRPRSPLQASTSDQGTFVFSYVGAPTPYQVCVQLVVSPPIGLEAGVLQRTVPALSFRHATDHVDTAFVAVVLE